MEIPSASAVPVHDPETMRPILQRHLGGTDETSLRITECSISNTRRRDGSRGTIQYELSLEDPATGRVWDEVVTGVTFGGNRTRRAWEAVRKPSLPANQQVAQPALQPFAYVPELDLLLQVFPNDYRLPGLAALTTGAPPELLPVLMQEFGPGEWERHRWDATTVQYRVDMRAILRLSLEAINTIANRVAERQFYAKVYRDAEQGRRAYRTQQKLHERVSAVETHLIIAKPVIYLDELRTLVTEAVPGTSLSKIIRRGEGSIDAVRSAARAIAEFHRLDVAAPARPITEEIIRLQEALGFLSSAQPALADELSAMVEAIIEGLASAPSALVHGDLKPDHLLIDGDRVALIDFDLIGSADPVIDVAHLISFLGKPQGRSRSRRDDTVDAAQVFVDEYFTHVPDTWRERLPLHHAMTSLHKAVGISRRRGAEFQQLIEDVLREGQAFLESDGDGSIPSYKRRLTRSISR